MITLQKQKKSMVQVVKYNPNSYLLICNKRKALRSVVVET